MVPSKDWALLQISTIYIGLIPVCRTNAMAGFLTDHSRHASRGIYSRAG